MFVLSIYFFTILRDIYEYIILSQSYLSLALISTSSLIQIIIFFDWILLTSAIIFSANRLLIIYMIVLSSRIYQLRDEKYFSKFN